MLCACVRGCVCAQRARPDVKSNPRSDSPARAGVPPPRRHPRAPPRHAVRRAALCAAHVARARRVAPRAPLVCCVVRACPGAVRACPGSARRLRPAAAGRGLPAPLVGPDCRPGAPGGWRLSAPQPIPPCRRQRLPPRGPGVSARVTSRARPHRVLTRRTRCSVRCLRRLFCVLLRSATHHTLARAQTASGSAWSSAYSLPPATTNASSRSTSRREGRRRQQNLRCDAASPGACSSLIEIDHIGTKTLKQIAF